uniref:ABCA1-4-like C-terminal R2 regulatory domain-containing protein n=1 Tax=Timema genevievae TaxID=629358 RepID=A0A7R9K9B0_TIMGE|nr:unnamed protein product [Timema genevievae]
MKECEVLCNRLAIMVNGQLICMGGTFVSPTLGAIFKLCCMSTAWRSASMEECEALCNRLAIMVNGQFVCMGGCQYLKHKFGQGFTVMIKLRSIRSEDNLKELKRAVEEQFQPSCVLKDEHQGLLHYHIQDPHVPWKVLFLGMERLKGAHQIVEDYTISETTLEQVFLAFARAQKQGN